MYEEYLRNLLEPLGVYDLRTGTVNLAELSALGQVRRAGVHRGGGRSAQKAALFPPRRPDGKAAQGGLPLLQREGDLVLPGGGRRNAVRRPGERASVRPENLVQLPAAAPAENRHVPLQGTRDLRSLQALRQDHVCLEGLPAPDLPRLSKEVLPAGHGPDPDMQLLPRRKAGEAGRRAAAIGLLMPLAAADLQLVQRLGIRLGPVQLHRPAASGADQELAFLEPGPLPPEDHQGNPRQHQDQKKRAPCHPGPHQSLGLNPGPAIRTSNPGPAT